MTIFVSRKYSLAIGLFECFLDLSNHLSGFIGGNDAAEIAHQSRRSLSQPRSLGENIAFLRLPTLILGLTVSHNCKCNTGKGKASAQDRDATPTGWRGVR